MNVGLGLLPAPFSSVQELGIRRLAQQRSFGAGPSWLIFPRISHLQGLEHKAAGGPQRMLSP